MTIRNLHKIFAARSVAVIGGSESASSVGRTVMLNLSQSSFPGAVYAVNPKHKQVLGKPCFESVSQLPPSVDLAIICTPAPTVSALLRECAAAGILGVVIISAGFRETGECGAILESELQAVSLQFPEMRIIGPNCLGFMAPYHGLNASFASDMANPGKVAFISQSGALCTSILDWALQEQIGFSYFVSVGNMLDVSLADLIDYFAQDRWTESIVLYIESLTDARQFMSAARAFTRTRPIIAYKAGRFAQSAQAAASHTGAMAGVDSVYETALSRAGIVRVFEVDNLFDCAELLARQRPPQGPRLAIVTNAGGPGVMATDCLIDLGGQLAELSDKTLDILNQQLPSAWSHSNPVDVLGDATPERFELAARSVLADSNTDGLLAILTPQAMTDPSGAAQALVRARGNSSKPLLAAWMGGGRVQAGITCLNQAGIATYSSPEKAVRAFMSLVDYQSRRETLYETPRAMPVSFTLSQTQLQTAMDLVRSENQDVLSEVASKALLAAYGIPISPTHVAHTVAEALDCARQVGWPIVLKILSPDITHKSDVGGVELNLKDESEVEYAFERMMSRIGENCPSARIDGVTVQPMIVRAGGLELIVGAKRDSVFGMVLMVGAGGVSAELLQDHALELPPLNERLVLRMLQSLRCWPLLNGYRGRAKVNIDRLIEVLLRLSHMIAEQAEIVELDINPLLVNSTEIIALDARMVIDREALQRPPRRYAHLAIRPYPSEYQSSVQLASGKCVSMRPLQPEDEPMWHALLASCSPETLHQRFRYMFKATTHEMATRFCFPDYDRDLPIAALVHAGDSQQLIGVTRLMSAADRQEAEFAILVADAWQGTGVGSALTDYCLSVAKQWGLQFVTAQVASQNPRMLGMLQRRGFLPQQSSDEDTELGTICLKCRLSD